MSETDTYPWFVLRTKSRRENIVEGGLEQKQINTFLPKRRIARAWKGKRRIIVSPLFPGYVFVQPHPHQFEDLRFIPGSCGLICAGNTPARIPECDLESVRIMIRSGAELSVNEELVPGRRVEVLSGPFKGVQGEIARIKNKLNLFINAHMIGKSVQVEISAEKINVL